MKKLGFGIVIIVSFIGITFYFSFLVDNLLGNDKDQYMEESNSVAVVDKNFEVSSTTNQIASYPKILEENGLHTLIGKGSNFILEKYGEPERTDLSSYGYEWWIYPKVYSTGYLQVGIENEKVVTIYGIGEELPTAPYRLNVSYSELESIVPFTKEVSLNIMNNSYQFSLTDEELRTRPLISVDGIFIQLYFDLFTNQLSSIRYLDATALVKHRPYSVVYRGELIEPEPLTSDEWREVEVGSALQILQITNEIRKRNNLTKLRWDDETAIVAYNHSKDMKKNDFFSHTSPNEGELKDRLKKQGILFQLAGENIAANYIDAIAAVEGWLNSEGHRVNLLHEDFTHLGVGVYERYYTQNFMTPW
ncbi:CAP domain-containing protein [Anaerobacillus alkalidiazotrophicus]|nr:CAP domain-containing protein [Anaerobacillus alkalidiazotrophicus]